MIWVKINGIWVQSTPWIKTEGQWKQSSVYGKTNSVWEPLVDVGLKLFPNPDPIGNSLKSSKFAVSVFDGKVYNEAHVYSGVKQAWVNQFIVRRSPWVSGSYPIMNYLSFSINNSTTIKVSKVGTSISSIDIGPYRKNKILNTQISNGDAYIPINKNDKLWVTINNEVSSPLFIFADPPIPTYEQASNSFPTYTKILMPTGIHFVSSLTSVLPVTTNSVDGYSNRLQLSSNTLVYFPGGSYIKGNYNISGCNNLKIIGQGIISLENYDWWADFKDAFDSFKVGGTTFYSTNPYTNSNSYEDWRLSGNGVTGTTVINTPYYFNGEGSFQSIEHLKFISPWNYNTDGPRMFNFYYPQQGSKLLNSFIFNADDSCFPAVAQQAGNHLVSSCYINSMAAIFTNYFPGFNNGVANSQFYETSCIDIDSRCFIAAESDGSKGEAVFRLLTDTSLTSIPSNWRGPVNLLFSSINFENDLDAPLFQIGNLIYPFAEQLPGVGQLLGSTSGLRFYDITASSTITGIGNLSSNYISGFNSTNKVTDVTFTNLKINNVFVTDTNYDTYFDIVGATNKTTDNINFNVTGLELYSPQTESLRSSLYQVSIENNQNYYSNYVYSSTAKFGAGGVSGARAVFHYDPGTSTYKNRLWSLNDKPIISFTTFGSSSTRKVKVSANSNITSYTIRPKSKNFNPSVSSGSLYLDMSPKDKAWITINNDVSNTLFVFCDPLKPQVPSNNTLYFGPGVHHLSALAGAQVINASSNYSATPGDGLQRIETFYGASYSALQNYGYTEGQPFTIYLDGGSYVIGQFDFRGKNNIKVVGPGILAGDNVVEQCTRYVDDNFHTRLEPYGILSQLRGVTYAYQEQGLNTYDRVPSGLVVSGPTVINSHFINFPGMNVVDNVKLISPFMPNTDIKAPMPDGATSAAIMRDCMIFLGDDAIIPTPYNAYPTQPNTGYLNIGGQFDISGCQVYTVNGGPLVIPYFGVLYPSSTPRAYPIKVYDMDFGIYTLDEGGGGRNGVPIDSENGEVAIRITMDMSSIYSGAWDNGLFKYGINNVTVSNIRFDDPIDQALIWVGNVPDPYFPTPVSFRGDEHGSLSGISFIDISVSSHPGYTYQIRSNLLFSKNATNRPKDITFKNISIDGVILTNANYTTYFQVSGIDSGPPDLNTDNINFTT